MSGTDNPDIIICGVDNDETRIFVSEYGLAKNIPVIFSAVSRDANQGYVFIQKPGAACFGCVFPEAINNEATPCPGAPAMKDILKVVGGLVLFAVDTVLMDRPCNWNFRMTYLSGFLPDRKDLIPERADCPICSKFEGNFDAKS